MNASKKTALVLIAWCFGVFSLSGYTADLSPLQLVQVTVDDVIQDMNDNEALYTDDQTALEAMVERRIVPHFNVGRMTQIALGKNWSAASPEQRKQVGESFKDMLIRSYTNSMFIYRKEKIALQGDEQIKGRNATVKLRVNRQSGDPVDLLVRMYESQGQWQVIDVVVGGVSMLITFRGLFQDEVSQGGIEGLIQSLQNGALGGAGNGAQ